jgi:hypothetical protein
MNDASTNPIFVALLFILRCLVPLAILFGISYLLRKMGLVAIEAPEPPDDRGEGGEALEEATGESLEPSEASPNETPTVEPNKEP